MMFYRMGGWVLGERSAVDSEQQTEQILMLCGQETTNPRPPQSAYSTTAADICWNPS